MQDRKDLDEEIKLAPDADTAADVLLDDMQPSTPEAAAMPGAPAVKQEEEAESEEEWGEENVGQWSPATVPPEQIVGLDVIAEEDDLRLLELQRAQVCVVSAKAFVIAACTRVVRSRACSEICSLQPKNC